MPAVGAVLFLALASILIMQGVPLGHDESVYATRAREMLGGEDPSTWWAANRAPGLSVVLQLAWFGEGTEPFLRGVVAMSGVLMVVSVWFLANVMVGRRAASIATVAVALSPLMLMSATQVWPDVPGAAVGLATLAIYANGLASRRMAWWVPVSVVVLTVMATLIRFGAPIPITVGLVGLTLWKWPRGGRNKAMVGVTALGVAALVGWILFTSLITGGASPIDGIAARSSSNPLLQGFSDYWGMRSRLATAAMAVGATGLALGVFYSFRRKEIRRRFIAPFLIGAATMAAIATLVHGELRYLMPVVPWFWLSASVGLDAVSRSWPGAVNALVGVGIIGLLFVVAPIQGDDAMRFNEGFQNIENAASSLRGQGACGVFTSYTPQVEWYSGCESVGIDQNEVVVASESLPSGPLFLFMVEKGKRQPDEALFAEYILETTGSPEVFIPRNPRYRTVEIWRVAP